MALPPLARFLDCRLAADASAGPISSAVNIPFPELPNRMHELPPRRSMVRLTHDGPAAGYLKATGRKVEIVTDWKYGAATRGRLWSPNAFLLDVARQLRPTLALDLACGSGRDAVALAGLGWSVTAVDHLPDALELGQDLARRYLSAEEAARIEWRLVDLEAQSLSLGGYGLVSTFWYLNRELIAKLPEMLDVGGSFVMETFTSVHRERFGKPRTEAFVLRPGELKTLVPNLAVAYYEEGWHHDRHSARIWATR